MAAALAGPAPHQDRHDLGARRAHGVRPESARPQRPQLVARHPAALGRRPPGPAPEGLRLPPTAALLGSLAYHEFHRFDIERRRAEAIIGFARRADALERLAQQPADTARERLQAIRGIGPWTASIVVLLCHGDPDSVIVGDYQIPSYVSWHFARERRGDDERMLELLEPYRGQRARVQALAKSAGPPPRHGPRMPLQDLQGR